MGTGPINELATVNSDQAERVLRRRNVLKRAVMIQAEFERRMRWRSDHIAWIRERLGLSDIPGLGSPLWEKQDEVWRSVIEHRKTHCKSGHKTGKTKVAAMIALWYLDCYRPSRVITTSASWPDVKMKLWGHIRDLYRGGGEWFGVPINMTDLMVSDRHYAMGFSCDRVEAAAGHNERYVLAIVDEASAVSQEFIDAIEAEATRVLEIGNPLLPSGAFYQHARSSEYHHIHISCYDHPNVKSGQEIIPGGPSREWCEDRRVHWGEKDPRYMSRILGEFPEESEDTLFPISVISECFRRYEEVKGLPRIQDCKARLGIDVARAGGDHTVGFLHDRVSLGDITIPRFSREINLKKTEHHGTRLRATMICKERKVEDVNVDAGGEGSGLADEMIASEELREIGCETHRILFGANASDSDYYNVRAEMYGNLSKLMKAGAAIEGSPELEEELIVTGGMAGLKEKSIDGQKRVVFYLPPKEEIKDELEGRSPDEADGLALAAYRAKDNGWIQYMRESIRESQERNKGNAVA